MWSDTQQLLKDQAQIRIQVMFERVGPDLRRDMFARWLPKGFQIGIGRPITSLTRATASCGATV
jgi:hypothetical protein